MATKAKSEEYRVNNIRVTSSPISNVPIWLFPVKEIDLNGIEIRKEWEEGEKAYKASQYMKNNHYRFLDIYAAGFKDVNDTVGIVIYPINAD